MPTNPTVAETLYDQTSTANAQLDTGALDSHLFDSLLIEEIPSGAASAASLVVYDGAISTKDLQTVATTADSNARFFCWSENAVAGGSGRYLGGIPGPVPPQVRFVLGALGVGITGRLRVLGRRHSG